MFVEYVFKMQHLEVSCAVRPIYGSLGAKWLRVKGYQTKRTSVSFSSTNSKLVASDCQQDYRGLFKAIFI
jgi:hypothetical protein